LPSLGPGGAGVVSIAQIEERAEVTSRKTGAFELA
jgi:hypothetical protein